MKKLFYGTRIWMWLSFLAIAAKKPFKLLRLINVQNIKGLIYALKKEHPIQIAANFRKLLLGKQVINLENIQIPYAPESIVQLHLLQQQLQTDYQKWDYRNKITAKSELWLKEQVNTLNVSPLFSLVIPIYNTEKKILTQLLESIQTQYYSNWEAILVDDGSDENQVAEVLNKFAKQDQRFKVFFNKENLGVVGATNEGLKKYVGDYLILIDHDDYLEKDALLQITKFLEKHPKTDLLYTDNDRVGEDNTLLSSQFKATWSPELLYAYCYVVHLKVFSKKIIQQTGLFNEEMTGAQDYDYFLRASEYAQEIAHLPLVLYHWRKLEGQMSSTIQSMESGRKAVEQALYRRGIHGLKVVQEERAKKMGQGVYRLVPTIEFKEKVSIIINVKNHYELIKACIDSIEQKTTYAHFEIIITDDESDDIKTINYLKELSSRYKVLWLKRSPNQGFNYAKLNNIAVQSTAGDYIVFLNADTSVISENWLEELLLYARMPDIGIVGTKLLYPDNHIQHAGVVVGCNEGLADHAFKHLHKDVDNYLQLANVPRNCSAVTAACMMIKKSLFEAVGGFDEIEFPIAYNDVDLCLKVLQKQQRIVYNPHCQLYHYEGSFRGAAMSGNRTVKDELRFLKKWGAYKDMFYHPNLSLKIGQLYQENPAQNTRLFQFNQKRPKKRVLSVSHNLNWEGAPFYKLAFDGFIHQQSDMEIVVLCLEDGPLRERYEALGIDVILPDWTWSPLAEDFYQLVENLKIFLKQEQFDLVFANTIETFWAIEGAYAVQIPSIWNFHESVDYHDYFTHFTGEEAIKAIGKTTIIKANRLIFASHATAKLYEPYDFFKTAVVIHNGISLAQFRALKEKGKTALKKELSLPLDKTIVTIVGTTRERKGQLDFAKAAIAILEKRQDVVFYIVGARPSPYLDKIKKQIRHHQGDIHLIEETPNAMSYFGASDIFVCASYNESFPRVILEAMYFELPIVSTPVFGIIEQLVHRKTGLFFEAGDVKQLCEQLNDMLNHPDKAQQMGQQAFDVLKQKFTEEMMVKKYYDLFKGVNR